MPAKTPKAKAPASQPFGSFGSRREVPERYLFGTPEEVDNRIATGYKLGGTPPENAVPTFQQIRPGPTGQDANDPSPRHYGGDSKYGSPRRYI